MSIGLSLSFSLFRFSGIGICCCSCEAVGLVVIVEFEEFVAAVVGITEHPIFLWLHLGLGLTQGHSRLFTEIVLWTCCQTGFLKSEKMLSFILLYTQKVYQKIYVSIILFNG